MTRALIFIILTFSILGEVALDNKIDMLIDQDRKEVESIYYELIEQNNELILKDKLKDLENINGVNKFHGYNLLSYAFINSKYNLIPTLKESGGQIDSKSVGSFKGQYIRYLNEINIKELVAFGYPSIYNFKNESERAIDGLPFVYMQMVLYMLENPFDTFENFYDSYSFLLRTLGNDAYKVLENYILALLNTNYKWGIKVGEEEYNIDFNFVDKNIDKKGFTRIGASSFIYGEDIMSIDQRKEEYLWTISKFFHRRGEVFGQICSYYILRLLEEERGKDIRAQEIYDKYAFELKERYNTFAINWNKGILPEYPYDRYKGFKNRWGKIVKVPIHIDGGYLKSQRDILPIINEPEEGKKLYSVDYKDINYFRPGFEIIKEELNKITKDSKNEDIKNLFDLINMSSYKNNDDLWIEFYFVIKDNNLNSNFKNWILDRIIILNTGTYERVLLKHYNFIERLINKDYIYDAIKVYNALKIRGIQHYETIYEQDFKEKLGGALALSVSEYLTDEYYSQLEDNHTLKKFLLKDDYEDIEGFDGEIIILLDFEEIKKITDMGMEMINTEGVRGIDLIRKIPPQTFLSTWPREEKAIEIYKEFLLEYIKVLDRDGSKVELTIRFALELVEHGVDNREIYEVLVNNYKKSYERSKIEIYKEEAEKFEKILNENY